MTTDRRLTLDVTDCGPLGRACVELRPLTVFVGPSNTGKSWLATLAYALHRYFGDSPRVPGTWFWTTSEAPLPEDARTDLARIAEQLRAVTAGSPEPVENGIELTSPVQEAIRLHLKRQGGAIGEEIERCFGVDAGGQIVRKQGAGSARILLRHAVEGVSTPAVHELTFDDGGWTFRPTVPDGVRVQGNRYEWLSRHLAELLPAPPERDRTPKPHAWDAAIGALANDVLSNHHFAFYLPADRTGLMSAHSAVVSALIQGATRATAGRADPVARLSGVRGDFLAELVDMASPDQGVVPSGRSRLRKLGRRVEAKILGGSIKVGSPPGVAYPHFTYHPPGWETGLPLTNASSMVSELAPVVLFLRHVVASGDLLIIDEPESHLHPAMQVEFTRLLAAIVGAGVRIILTTHSEWVLEELGNVIGRAKLTDRSDGKADVEPLDARDVGVWLFEPAGDGPGSTNVQEIALDAESGLYPSGFDTVATALHNDWAEIASRRGDAE